MHLAQNSIWRMGDHWGTWVTDALSSGCLRPSFPEHIMAPLLAPEKQGKGDFTSPGGRKNTRYGKEYIPDKRGSRTEEGGNR